MTKPWEETWTAERETLHGPNDEVTPADWWIVRKGSVRFVGSEYREDEAKLTAAAPDMAQLLLAIEMVLETADSMEDVYREVRDLRSTLDRVLEKAGVR